MPHIPVLLSESIKILNPQPGEFFIDGTTGSGGHSAEILKRISPNGVLLCVDLDKEMLTKARRKILTISRSRFPRLAGRQAISKLILVNDNYANLPEILKDKNLPKADGLILDLGFSSEQLENSGRGFTFQKDEPLDMRYNAEIQNSKSQILNLTAAEVINNFSEKELADIIYKYGEERFSRRIARKIAEERRKGPIRTTFELVDIIKMVVPGRGGRLHPATRTFQALRIYVNKELENLEKLLKNLTAVLQPNGRAVIISFHSLEDRLVKIYFKELSRVGKAEILTKKPIRPTLKETQQNPRARSARLRAIKFL